MSGACAAGGKQVIAFQRLPKVAKDCQLATFDQRLEILAFRQRLPKVANSCTPRPLTGQMCAFGDFADRAIVRSGRRVRSDAARMR